MSTLRSWYLLGTRVLVVRLALVGAAAGAASWALVLALHLLFGLPRPDARALALAMPRGALVGAVLAWAMAAYWSRRPRQRDRGS